MDLGAYAQIDELDTLAKKNGIEVPRLRGYRLMKNEKMWDTKKDIEDIEHVCCEFLFCPDKKVSLDKIHGWKRKVLKFEIKKQIKRINKQADVFNKYVGRDDILYIHARIGGGNWDHYKNQVIDKPWFIEKVDDYFDSTYCDIYAKVSI